ncbi:element excision factor XisH family protein [Microcoleus sp. OTE_8_concoct_300]|uniref:element excision factor XisH family protein n=1 Tax=Microcoleus sp. OTE_8_concoct_300 TaxID=2964710 RepID=UPI00403F87C3
MAKDIYHYNVRAALEKDGWIITDDPLTLQFGSRGVFVDLGAKKLLAAEREGQRIAVEIKSFVGKSLVKDWENAIGQYTLYLKILSKKEPDRTLYLAITEEIYTSFFNEDIVQVVLADGVIKIIVVDTIQEVITRWIN